jgi:hypothetical protein
VVNLPSLTSSTSSTGSGQQFADSLSSLVVHASTEKLSCIPPIIFTSVFGFVTKLLLDSSIPKSRFVQRMLFNVDEVLTVLTRREEKAKQKYGHGLALEDPVDSLPAAADKLADAVFHLTRVKETKNPKFPYTNDQLKIINNIKGLLRVTQNLIGEM